MVTCVLAMVTQVMPTCMVTLAHLRGVYIKQSTCTLPVFYD